MTAAEVISQDQLRQVTIQKVALLERQFGERYRLLAYHAALPLILTPELVHYLRTEFLRDEVPWEAEADLLLSDLCSQVGYELYVMDTDMRAYLLEQMQQDERIAPERIQQIAQLLMSYVNYLREIHPEQRQRELQAQRWAAMAYLGEERSRQMVDEIIAEFEASGNEGNSNTVKAELARLVRITQELTVQLTNYPELLRYTAKVNQAIRQPHSMPPEELQRAYEVGDRVLRLPGSEHIPGFPPLEILSFTTAQLRETLPPPNWPPPLQTEEFTVATIVFEEQLEPPPPLNLEPFRFEVAKLVKQSSRGSEWEIVKSDSQAMRYLEQLDTATYLEMVAIPAGTFMMGTSNSERISYSHERLQHKVAVPNFYLGRYPITQAQWQIVAMLPQIKRSLNPRPSHFEGETRPVEKISWEEATEFCARLSNFTQRQYRLPTEAEWEYACRAGTTTPFHFGETISPKLANYNCQEAFADSPRGNYKAITTPVGYFTVTNDLGLSDMHGNVWEWCQDHWHPDYIGAPTDGSARFSAITSKRIIRGGSWNDIPKYCRSASRNSYSPNDCNHSLGLRIVCSSLGL
jgi:formylglycine-generating enzyme required for sulfatase activity